MKQQLDAGRNVLGRAAVASQITLAQYRLRIAAAAVRSDLQPALQFRWILGLEGALLGVRRREVIALRSKHR